LAESFRLGKRTPCFVDEVRKPVYVGDMVRLVAAVVSRSEPSDLSGKVLNVGGPECCTRYEMAHAVMAAVGGTEDLLEERRATETDFGYRRPLSQDNAHLPISGFVPSFCSFVGLIIMFYCCAR